MRSSEHRHSTGWCDLALDVAKSMGASVALAGLTAVLG